ncbi:MAG: hypothetical protein JJ975_03885 [Bacteroidia bacterium]|nr:hypothetical protein [Bacteroidia bacterium]
MVIHIKKRIQQLLSIALLTVLIGGCDNSLDVTTDWKEIPVVYGLLNPSATYNYIRVNRAYLNQEGDAISFAATADSIQFSDLTVTLVEYRDGIELNSVVLNRVDGDTIGLPKEEGVFAQSPNILYRTAYDIKPSDFTGLYHYELVVVNNVSNKVYRSRADVVGNTEMLSPIRSQDPSLNIDDDSNRFIFINYREAPRARMYDCEIRFRYKEYPKNDPGNVRVDSVSWVIFKNKLTIRLRGYEEQSLAIKSHLFYDFLASAIEADSNLQREPIDMGFYLYGGGEDLYTYIQVNQPSIGIVQKKPEFTNIEDGLGIFSSLSILAYDHVKILDIMRNRLAKSSRVAELNFVTP